MIALGLDLSNLRVDTGGLLTLRNGNLILEALQGFLAGLFVNIGNNVLSEIKHTVQVAARDIKQHSQLRRDTARVPDVRYRSRQCDMPHALAANRGARHFNAAFFTDDSFVTRVLIFSTITLPVTGGTKNGLAEQSVFFRAKTAIVDRFWL